MAVLVSAFFTVAVRAAMRLRHQPPITGGTERLVGTNGVVVGNGLHPDGVVRVAAEEWQALAAGGPGIPAGTRVRVTAVDGLRITVEPVGHDETSPAGSSAPGLEERTTT
jgi:membrane-bound ClpP family serine protease